jgi:hypothetical protein
VAKRRPQHPPRPTGGKPPIYGGGGGPAPRPTRVSRQLAIQLAIQRAVGAVRNALMESGSSPADSLRLAPVLLSRPGVQIGRGGDILYKGARYDATAFAASKLGQLATGAYAKAQNQKALEGDPGYIQALATLGLQRDQSIAGNDDARRQALIEFGDPSFAKGDATTAGAAGANPFSTSRLLQQAYANAQSQTANTANRAGVYQGGGLTSGLGQDLRDYAGQNQYQTELLQKLLSSLDTQNALAQQGYQVGQAGAQTDAYNAMLASGYHALTAPDWNAGAIRVRGYGGRGGGGGAGGGGGRPGPARPPARGTYPTRTTYPTQGPIQYQPPAPPPRGPTQTQYPVPNPQFDLDAYLRRYGVR